MADNFQILRTVRFDTPDGEVLVRPGREDLLEGCMAAACTKDGELDEAKYDKEMRRLEKAGFLRYEDSEFDEENFGDIDQRANAMARAGKAVVQSARRTPNPTFRSSTRSGPRTEPRLGQEDGSRDGLRLSLDRRERTRLNSLAGTEHQADDEDDFDDEDRADVAAARAGGNPRQPQEKPDEPNGSKDDKQAE